MKKVVFLVVNESTWKLDTVFKKMLDAPYFEPTILVCPYTVYSEKRMWDDMEITYQYFINKQYPVVSSYDKERNKWITLDEINPDIVFFTNPHNLTKQEYYQDAYLNYLTCYLPYHHEVGSYHGDIDQYGRPFNACLWRFYSAHNTSFEQSYKFFPQKKKNIRVVGYPFMTEILQKLETNSFNNVWKSKDNRKKIIWAPHHTIDSEELPYSNFLIYAEAMKKLAEKYKNSVVWAFKPHPILKSKLYLHPDWGVERTNDYYRYWEEQEFTQINLSEYVDLFCSSDAMIHDCGSFLAEYLYTKKPVLYLLSEKNNNSFYNKYGLKALSACQQAKNITDIENFIIQIQTQNLIKVEHNQFISSEIEPLFSKNNEPSGRIINDIKQGILND